MTQPTFDCDGYPTEKTLAAIRGWREDCAALLRYIAAAWYRPSYAQEARPGLWVFATGGWSGNESLMDAMRESHAAGYLWHTDSIHPHGGLHVFAVTDEAKADMDAMDKRIRDWAWGRQEP